MSDERPVVVLDPRILTLLGEKVADVASGKIQAVFFSVDTVLNFGMGSAIVLVINVELFDRIVIPAMTTEFGPLEGNR